MKLTNFRRSALVAASLVAALGLAPISAWATGQRSGRSPGGSSHGSSGGQPRSGGGEGSRTATPRGDGGTNSGGATARGSESTPGTPTETATAVAEGTGTGQGGGTARQRSADGRPIVGHAVPRGGSAGPGGGTTIIVPGGYYGGYLPWGYGGLGFAGYYGGYYDPGYGYPQYSSSGEEGALRLKVKPADASVFVDGYFAGQVEDFNGVFQRLHIDAGPHRIEISADGYETLSFEIRSEPGRTITYSGTLTQVR